MKILVVSHRVPYPLKDGGVIAMHSLLHGLKSAGAQVKLLCLNPKKDGVDTAQLPQYFYTDFGFEAFAIDTNIKATAALANLFTKKSYQCFPSQIKPMTYRVLSTPFFHLIVSFYTFRNCWNKNSASIAKMPNLTSSPTINY